MKTPPRGYFFRLPTLLLSIFFILTVYGNSMAQDVEITEEPPVAPEIVVTDPPTEVVITEPPAPIDVPTVVPTEVPPTQEATPEVTIVPPVEGTVESTIEPTIESTIVPGEPPIFNLGQSTFDAEPGLPLIIEGSVTDDAGIVRIMADTAATLGTVSLEFTEPVESAAPFNTLIKITYLAPSDFAGMDSFTLNAIDASGESTLFTVQVNVLASEATVEAEPAAQITRDPNAYQLGQTIDTTGWVNVLWLDPKDHTQEGDILAIFTDEQGKSAQLLVDDTIALELDRKHVRLSGEVVDHLGAASAAEQGASGNMTPIIDVEAITGLEDISGMADIPALASGPKKWITIMCRFPDVGSTPTGFSTSYITNMFRNTYPGLNHYWNEISYGYINLDGSVVHPTAYTLPQSFYSYTNGQDPNFVAMFQHCVSLADASINFNQYHGINLLFNAEYGFPQQFAVGGSITITLDGTYKSWPTTWLPPFGYEEQGVFAHEMGHAFGLKHSSGPYSAVYDSAWDVMSQGAEAYCPYNLYPDFICIGVGTIAYNRDELGFIPADRKVTVPVGTGATVTLQPLNQAPAGSDDMIVVIPIGSSGQFYTLESRRFIGYDSGLPAQAVIIHSVDNNRADGIHAKVVDPDGNGNPNDASAQWLTGETFVDSTNDIRVQIVSLSGSIFTVKVTNAAPAQPTNLAAVAASQTQINLTWMDNATNETGYRVERSAAGANTWTEIVSLGANVNNYQNTGLTCSTGYDYRVRAYRSSNGSYSDYSSTASATTQVCNIPAPTDLVATAISQTQIDLTWVDNTSDETEFRIERSLAGANSWTQIAVLAADSTSYSNNTGLTCGTNYDYRVRAYRSSDGAVGVSDVVTTATHNCPPPIAPTGLTTTAISHSQINLSWTDNATDETGYRIERSLAGANSWAEIAQLNANATSYSNTTGLTCETGYDYQVRAYRSTGGNNYSDYSNPSSAITTTCPPATPSNLAGSAISLTQIDLTWIDNADDETEYRLERSQNGGGWTQLTTLTANSQTYSDTSVVCSTNYQYRIYSYRADDVMSSSYSNTAAVSTPTCPLSAPSNFTVSPLQVDTQYGKAIRLTWTPAPSADSLYLEISDAGWNNWRYAGIAYGGVYDIYFLSPCTAYDFRAQSYRQSDNVYSNYTDAVRVVTLGCLPIKSAPRLNGPANNTETQNTQPSFWWNEVANATNYELQIATDKTFSNVIHAHENGYSVGWTAENPINGGVDGVYYWRVRGKNAAGAAGPWSAPFIFKIDLTPPSAAPVLTKPVDNSHTADTTPAFTWKKMSDAKSYQLQISANSDCSSPFYTSVAVTSTSFTLPNINALTDEGTYFWCVRGIDAAGNQGLLSTSFDFQLTLLKSPLNGSATTDTTPAFSWNKAPGTGVTYHLLVDDNPDLGSPIIDQPGLTKTSFTSLTLLPAGKVYYWRVAVSGANWNAPTPVVWSLLLNPIKLVAPTITTPVANGFSNDITPEVVWTGVSAVEGVTITYQLQIDDDSRFGSPYTISDLTTSPHEIMPPLPSTPGTRYNLRMRAVYDGQAFGPWSKTVSFTLDTVAPSAAPALTAPADGSTATTNRPTFSWNAVTGAVRYELRLQMGSNPPINVAQNNTARSYRPAAPMSSGVYYWQVIAYDAANNPSPASAVRSVEIP